MAIIIAVLITLCNNNNGYNNINNNNGYNNTI